MGIHPLIPCSGGSQLRSFCLTNMTNHQQWALENPESSNHLEHFNHVHPVKTKNELHENHHHRHHHHQSLFLSLISCLSPTRKISHFPFTHSTPKPSVAGIRVDSKDEMLRSDTTTNANDVEAPWWHPENHPWNKRGWGLLIHSDWIPSRSLTNCPWKGYAVGNCKGWKIITGIQFQWWSKIWKMKAHLLKLTLSFWFLNQVLKNLGFNSHKNWGWWWRRWRWCISYMVEYMFDACHGPVHKQMRGCPAYECP